VAVLGGWCIGPRYEWLVGEAAAADRNKRIFMVNDLWIIHSRGRLAKRVSTSRSLYQHHECMKTSGKSSES